MITRVIVLVIDGLDVRAMPDAAEYGDAGSHTLSHLADAVGGLNLPTEALGLATSRKSEGRTIEAGRVFDVLNFRRVDSMASYGRLSETLPGRFNSFS